MTMGKRPKINIFEGTGLDGFVGPHATGRPPRVCTQPGCHVLTSRGRCNEHSAEKRAEAQRFTVKAYGRPWRRVRDVHLMASPWCVECLKTGHTTLGTDVDHVIPHKGDRALMLDPSNLQTLCQRHHGQKTVRETWHPK